MKLNILVVTKYKWDSRDKKHQDIKKIMMQKGNGIDDISFTVKYADLGTPTMYVDNLGVRRIEHNWFEKNISQPAKMEGFNVAVFNFSDIDGLNWGIAKGHRGSNIRDGDFFGECWIKCDENSYRDYKKGRDRLTYVVDVPHEIGHELNVQGLTGLNVHRYDYQRALNNIEKFYKEVRITTEGEINSMYGRILDLRRIVSMFNTLFAPKKDLYQSALKYVGTDASPNDKAPDEVGCAESVSEILNDLFPNFPIWTGTWNLGDYLSKDARFERKYYSRTDTIPSGTIIICRTLPNKPFPGHVGIVGINNTIFSNDSRKEFLGKFLMNYTYEKWIERWCVQGGYAVEFYQIKN